MCGIAGYWSPKTLRPHDQTARAMGQALAHRGPDGAGEWVDAEAGFAMAHRRLSIIDLTSAGQQPMHSASGRYILSFNGEIYNHADLRRELDGSGHMPWRGTSDTETLLAAISNWGLKGALERANGMFALAVWDRKSRSLQLARDRMGEKPLYYGRQGDTFLFGSELKALKQHPAWENVLDREAATLFLRHSYVPSPFCIFRGISKLEPAHFVTIAESGQFIGQPECYWRFEDAVSDGARLPFSGNEADATDALESIFADAVQLRMASDVPLGAFLSGGIDSSATVAMMQSQSGTPVRTFSIGFDEAGYNEAQHARGVADHLCTDHTELYVQSNDALSVIPHLPEMWDEPFADSSQIPTYLVSRMAREHVTVSLSGDGGDELFCGYNRYTQGYDIWRKIRLFPKPLQKALAILITQVSPGLPDTVMKVLPPRLRIPALGDRCHALP